MEASPLTQQARPETFQPKIVQLYQDLFNVSGEFSLSEGFWREFFSLPPDKEQFRDILEPLSADDILLAQDQTQSFFARAITEVQAGGAPRKSNAFENLTAFLGGVLSKKYTNPSADVIAVLAGLDKVDNLVSDLVNAIDDTIRNGGSVQARSSAIETALVLTAGAYQTGLVTYFTHRDLFPALMKFVKETDDPPQTVRALLLLGLLVNYNKFEFQNPYQNRVEDFVNESVIQSITRGIGSACANARNEYVAVQDDTPEGWNISSALVYVGLRSLTPEAKRKPPPTEDEANRLFSSLPSNEASILLPTYSFIYSNKLFASVFISTPSHSSKETPLAAFLSLASYLSHHAYRTERCLRYTLLSLLTIQSLVEDAVLIKRLSSDQSKTSIRLCRQRTPSSPLTTTDRTPASAILDICADLISHNLRRRLDIPLYSLTIGILLRTTTQLSRNKTRLQHHWSYLWATLFSLMRFLTQYARDLGIIPDMQSQICAPLTQLIAFCLSAGDTFLPNPSDYDDLFYKLIEVGTPLLTRFRDAYFPAPTTSTSKPPSSTSSSPPSIRILISVCTHYSSLVQSQSQTRKITPRAVQEVIKQGYETLSIEGGEGLGEWEVWREKGAWRGEVKRLVRVVVEDVRGLR